MNGGEVFLGGIGGVLLVILYQVTKSAVSSKIHNVRDEVRTDEVVDDNSSRLDSVEQEKVDKTVCKLRRSNIQSDLGYLKKQLDEVKETVDEIYKMNGGE